MDISLDLCKIWARLEETAVMRASLFNLIIVASEGERKDYIRQIIHKVIERFPCRIMMITLSDRLQNWRAHVTATTGVGGKADIACDMIEIEAPRLQIAKIPFLILPHFLPDLPIYLLWAENPSADPQLLSQLQKWATRLIYDSEVSDNLHDFAQSLLTQRKSTGKEVADLNWARTENWRELLAATFYSPARLSSIREAKTIHLYYNTFETPFFCHTKIQALYLQAWLATRLNWKLMHATSDIWSYHECQIFLHPLQNSELAPGTVLSLDILCKDQSHFAFHRDPLHPHQVQIILCDEEKCDIPSRFIFSKAQSGLSLVNQIYHSDPSSHFPVVLQFLSNQERSCLSSTAG